MRICCTDFLQLGAIFQELLTKKSSYICRAIATFSDPSCKNYHLLIKGLNPLSGGLLHKVFFSVVSPDI